MIAGGVDGENIGNSHPVVKTCVLQLHDCQACSIASFVSTDTDRSITCNDEIQVCLFLQIIDNLSRRASGVSVLASI